MVEEIVWRLMILLLGILLGLWMNRPKQSKPAACPMCGKPLPLGVGRHACAGTDYQFSYQIIEREDSDV